VWKYRIIIIEAYRVIVMRPILQAEKSPALPGFLIASLEPLELTVRTCNAPHPDKACEHFGRAS